MMNIPWAGLATYMLAVIGAADCVAEPAHLSQQRPSAIVSLDAPLTEDAVRIELVNVSNPDRVLFYVTVEQSWDEEAWLKIASLSPFPSDQDGGYAVRLKRLKTNETPCALRVQMKMDDAQELPEDLSVTIVVKPLRETSFKQSSNLSCPNSGP